MNTIQMVEYLNSGKSQKDLEKHLKQIDLEKAKEKGKRYGECASCGNKTVLVAEVGLCGPCCFGEADTANGEW